VTAQAAQAIAGLAPATEVRIVHPEREEEIAWGTGAFLREAGIPGPGETP
jgi:hypothetical protein